ncbi:helix-turn-helix domain-containing protein [Hymenobacter fodinae]|uniref:XRE family transcriptional regulator n=1 Tax=Hymenobacter fodinae TaxID=2510796 RepID=A0A4Z0PBZ5_9BACT|nr:XRE family transcriptional regulator [Hymenobacter fodinae]
MKHPVVLQAFGIHIRKLREARGFSQQELADHADIAKATIQRIEQAKFSVTLDVLVSLAQALQIRLKDIMDFPDAE